MLRTKRGVATVLVPFAGAHAAAAPVDALEPPASRVLVAATATRSATFDHRRTPGTLRRAAGRASGPAAHEDEALHEDEREQQQADHDPRPPRAERALERDQRLDHAEHEHAEHRPEQVA